MGAPVRRRPLGLARHLALDPDNSQLNLSFKLAPRKLEPQAATPWRWDRV
jgi:hypothetical protein